MAKRTGQKFQWNDDDFTVSDEASLPGRLEKVASEAPDGDKEKAAYLQGLVKAGDITPADVALLMQSGALSGRGMVTKAQSDAPNYRPAETIARCKNCRFFRGDPGRDWCERFDFTADRDYVCDDWAEQRPSETPGFVVGRGSLGQTMKAIIKLNEVKRKRSS